MSQPMTDSGGAPGVPAAIQGIYPTALAEAEQKLVEGRRARWDGGAAGPIAGLALSGGGIRSATFCLGFLQALAGRKLLQRFDFLSTVSGGGYVGSFLGAWINRRGDAALVQDRLARSDSAPTVFLRNNGRYLAPNGAADAMAAMAAYLRSWLTVWLVLGLMAFGALLLVETAKIGLNHKAWMDSLATTVPAPEQEKAISMESNGAAIATTAPATVAVTTGDKSAVPAVSVAVTVGAGKEEGVLSLFKRYLRVSPFFAVAGWVLLLFGLPAAVAYWFAGRSMGVALIWVLLLGIGATIGWVCARGMVDKWSNFSCWALWVTYGLAFALSVWATLLGDHPDVPRNTLNDWLSLVLGMAVAVAALAVVDTVGLTLTTNGVWSAAILPALAVAAQWMLPRIMEGTKDEKRSWSMAALIPVGALVVGIIAFGILSREAHRLAGALIHRVSVPQADAILVAAGVVFAVVSAFQFRSIKRTVAALVTIAAICWLGWWLGNRGGEVRAHALMVAASAGAVMALGALVGFSFAFVNLSSHHRLYSVRLTRTYLGASNPARTGREEEEKGAPVGARQTDPQPSPQTKDQVPLGRDGRDVTSAVRGDQIPFREYRPHASGGPLHLINVTVNETIDGISQIEEKDRHGFSMAVGPVGLSVRTKDHALFESESKTGPDADPGKGRWTRFKVGLAKIARSTPDRLRTLGAQGERAWLQPAKAQKFHTLATEEGGRYSVEMPALGSWVGISGAAFTTGLGARTSPAISFLLGFFNVRLGYWWDSGISPAARKNRAARGAAVAGDTWSRLFPAQSGLLDEWLARFRGAARRYWYLSDGGHFENTAVYELIRRRVPLIVCCDCGADPSYEFEDAGNLVRKARIDFGAEITFWTAGEVAAEGNGLSALKDAIGAIEDLKPARKGPDKGLAQRHAAVAWVTYGDGVRSLLLLVKPTLSKSVPMDVRNYDETESDFPQQSTLDQFFDEEQWESYRKLGAFSGVSLFGEKADTSSPAWEALVAVATKGRPSPDRLQPVG